MPDDGSGLTSAFCRPLGLRSNIANCVVVRRRLADDDRASNTSENNRNGVTRSSWRTSPSGAATYPNETPEGAAISRRDISPPPDGSERVGRQRQLKSATNSSSPAGVDTAAPVVGRGLLHSAGGHVRNDHEVFGAQRVHHQPACAVSGFPSGGAGGRFRGQGPGSVACQLLKIARFRWVGAGRRVFARKRSPSGRRTRRHAAPTVKSSPSNSVVIGSAGEALRLHGQRPRSSDGKPAHKYHVCMLPGGRGPDLKPPEHHNHQWQTGRDHRP